MILQIGVIGEMHSVAILIPTSMVTNGNLLTNIHYQEGPTLVRNGPI